MAKTLIPVHVDSFHPISLFIAVFLSIASGQSVKQPTLQISHFSGSMTDWGVQGDVKDAVTWIDSGDSSVLIVSEIQKGEINAKGYVSKVFGYHFIKQSGKWKMNFSIKEPNQSPNEIIHYQNGSIHIENVDGQGGAETIFFYSIAMDGGTEPLILKMIFHWNGIKIPIRGKIPRELDNEGLYEMTLDAKLKSAPKKIQEFAIKYWKAYVKSKYGEFVKNP